MTNEQCFISVEPFDGNLYTSSRIFECVQTTFTGQADISESLDCAACH
jgi:hypothetical protein